MTDWLSISFLQVRWAKLESLVCPCLIQYGLWAQTNLTPLLEITTDLPAGWLSFWVKGVPSAERVHQMSWVNLSVKTASAKEVSWSKKKKRRHKKCLGERFPQLEVIIKMAGAVFTGLGSARLTAGPRLRYPWCVWSWVCAKQQARSCIQFLSRIQLIYHICRYL